jgi:hypothetical protein
MRQVSYVTLLATRNLFLSFHALTMPLARNAGSGYPAERKPGNRCVCPRIAQHEKASPGRRGFRLFCSFHQTAKCPWGRVFRLPLVTTRERQSTRVKHRSQVVLITREARGRAPRVLTAPFGLDRSPANDVRTDRTLAKLQHTTAQFEKQSISATLYLPVI